MRKTLILDLKNHQDDYLNQVLRRLTPKWKRTGHFIGFGGPQPIGAALVKLRNLGFVEQEREDIGRFRRPIWRAKPGLHRQTLKNDLVRWSVD